MTGAGKARHFLLTFGETLPASFSTICKKKFTYGGRLKDGKTMQLRRMRITPNTATTLKNPCNILLFLSRNPRFICFLAFCNFNRSITGTQPSLRQAAPLLLSRAAEAPPELTPAAVAAVQGESGAVVVRNLYVQVFVAFSYLVYFVLSHLFLQLFGSSPATAAPTAPAARGRSSTAARTGSAASGATTTCAGPAARRGGNSSSSSRCQLRRCLRRPTQQQRCLSERGLCACYTAIEVAKFQKTDETRVSN